MSGRVLIVDGHSIIFAWPVMRKMHEQRTSSARDALIRMLTDYQDYTGTRVVAVFDGKGAQLTEMTEPAGIQVFYSGTGQTADDIVERLVAKYAKRMDITVATCDHLEQETASAFGALCIGAEQLKSLLKEARVNFGRRLKRHNRSPL